MNKFVLLAGIAALCATSVTADAKHRRRYYDPDQDNVIYLYDDEDDDTGYYVDDGEEEVIVLNRRERMREAERRVDEDMWWVEERARKKIEKRKKLRKVVEQTAPKKALKPKTVKQPADPIETASLSKPVVIAKPKPKTVVALKPKTDLPKTSVASKTIGCTAGAAVITGYGFGDVKPKVCTGATYSYAASRGGKAYEIKLASASGEITDVKKLN